MTDTTRLSPTYREVFRVHRLRFLVPVVLAGVVAGWAGATAPKVYRSGATLWSDSAASSTAVFGALPPAGQDQQLLNELLTTRYFQDAVAARSPLGAYLRAHPNDQSAPAALLAKLRGSRSLADRLAAALGPKRVTSQAKGPHVLEVNFDAPTPTLAVKTLRTIIAQFRQQREALRQDALVAAQKQVAAASNALRSARTRLTTYLGQHPGSTRNDPQLQTLAVAEREAATSLSNASDTMSQATMAVSSGAATQTVLRVIDAPQVPTGPTAGKKKLLETCIAGLFAGGVVSALGVVALARRQRRQGSEAAVAAAPEPTASPHQLLGARLEPVE